MHASRFFESRAVVKPGLYAVIPPEGRVFNVIPGFAQCRMTILCSPKIGAGFVQTIGTALPDGGTTRPYCAGTGEEVFLYLLDGEGAFEVTVGQRTERLVQGGYAYAPAGTGLTFRNVGPSDMRFLLHKQRFTPHPDPARRPHAVFGNVHALNERLCDGTERAFIRDLLPTDEAFDLNMHILSFEPGARHGFVETHVQEHGAYIYEGEGLYMLDQDWIPVRTEDFLWMGAFCRQGCYATGATRLSYIYSKDCNRDSAA